MRIAKILVKVVSVAVMLAILMGVFAINLPVSAAGSISYEFEDYFNTIQTDINISESVNPNEFVKVLTEGSNTSVQIVPASVGQYISFTFPTVPAGEYKVAIGHKTHQQNRGSADISFNDTLFKANVSFKDTANPNYSWLPIEFNETLILQTAQQLKLTMDITAVQGIMVDYILLVPVGQTDDESALPDYNGEDEYIACDFNIVDNNIVGIVPGTLVKHFLYRAKVKDLKGSSEVVDAKGAVVTDGAISTGMKLNIKNENNNVVKTYTILVYGDITCDGRVTIMDLLVQKTRLLQIDNGDLSAEAELTSDADHSGDLGAGDLMAMKQEILQSKPIDQKFNKAVDLIFDTDMMTDCDDMAALAMAHNMMTNREVNLLAMATSSRYKNSAPTIDTVNVYYNRPYIEIGAPKNGLGYYSTASVFLDKVSGEFPKNLASNDDAPDAVEVYRKTLAAADDNSVTLLTLGYSTNIASLMQSGADEISPLTGMELIEKKVLKWVNMGGNFPNDNASDNVNFTRQKEAAYYAITNWPIDLVFVGREIGHKIFVGDDLYYTPANNPVRRAYQLHRGSTLSNWNHHTADPSALLYAVRGLGDYFTISNYGYIDLKTDCSFTWKEDSTRKMRYVFQKMDRAEMGEVMEQLMIQVPDNRK